MHYQQSYQSCADFVSYCTKRVQICCQVLYRTGAQYDHALFVHVVPNPVVPVLCIGRFIADARCHRNLPALLLLLLLLGSWSARLASCVASKPLLNVALEVARMPCPIPWPARLLSLFCSILRSWCPPRETSAKTAWICRSLHELQASSC